MNVCLFAPAATSAKTLELLTDPRLRSPNQIYSTLTRYIDQAVYYSGGNKLIDLKAWQIRSKVSVIAMEGGGSQAQLSQIERAVDYAKRRCLPVQIIPLKGTGQRATPKLCRMHGHMSVIITKAFFLLAGQAIEWGRSTILAYDTFCRATHRIECWVPPYSIVLKGAGASHRKIGSPFSTGERPADAGRNTNSGSCGHVGSRHFRSFGKI